MGHGERFQVEICHFFGFCNWLIYNKVHENENPVREK